MIVHTTLQAMLAWADIRCGGCGKLLVKWHPTGVACLSVKCPRCGKADLLRLSTA